MFVQDNANVAKGLANRAERLPRIVEAPVSRQVQDRTAKPEDTSVEERPNSAHDRPRFGDPYFSEKIGTGKMERMELHSNRSPGLSTRAIPRRAIGVF
jgi:hypothetical protein